MGKSVRNTIGLFFSLTAITLLIHACGEAGGGNCPAEQGTLRQLNSFEMEVWKSTVGCLSKNGLAIVNVDPPLIARSQDTSFKGLRCTSNVVLISQVYLDNTTNARFPEDYDILIAHEFIHSILAQETGDGDGGHSSKWFNLPVPCDSDSQVPDMPTIFLENLFPHLGP